MRQPVRSSVPGNKDVPNDLCFSRKHGGIERLCISHEFCTPCQPLVYRMPCATVTRIWVCGDHNIFETFPARRQIFKRCVWSLQQDSGRSVRVNNMICLYVDLLCDMGLPKPLLPWGHVLSKDCASHARIIFRNSLCQPGRKSVLLQRVLHRSTLIAFGGTICSPGSPALYLVCLRPQPESEHETSGVFVW